MSAECSAVNVPPGYKQTEVGVIPEDWEVKCLGEIASVSAGGTPHRSNPLYWNGDIPWITTSEVSQCTIDHAEQFITKEGLNNSAAKMTPSGTILMALYGQGKTRGKVAILGIEASTNQACAAISLKKDAHPPFVFQFLASQYEAIRNLSNIGNQENLNSAIVRSINILLPPTLAEQEAISKALSDTDAFIESLEQLIAKKLQIKQGAMQELLTGKRRLSGFVTKIGYKQTEVGVIPEDWEVYTLGEIGKFKNGLNKDSQAFGHGSPFINLMDVFGVNSIASKEQLGLVECTSFEQSAYDLLCSDVIFVRSSVKPSGVGLTVVVEKDLNGTVYSGFLIRFRDGGFIDTTFKKYCFYEEGFRKKVIGSSSVSANTNINQDSLKRLSIPLPPTKAEQESIAAILSDMDSEITSLEEKLNKARQLKQGMMQELLTGKVRLI
jgi:type I restriction enzyme S subunit